MDRSKKAQMGFVVKMILIIVSAIILFIVSTVIFGQFIAKGEVEACRLSVVAQSNTKLMINPTGDKSPFNINCNKYYVNFFNTKVEGGYDPGHLKPIEIQYNGRKTKNIAVMNDYVFNQVMAEEMRKCWYQFGEGKLDVFDTSMVQGVSSIFGANDICFVCTEATIIDTQQGTFFGLIDYLKTTNIKKQGITYFEYLNSTPPGKDFSFDTYLQIFDKKLFEYHKGQKYMVIFVKQDKRLTTFVTDQKYFGPFAILPPAWIINSIISTFSDKNKRNNAYFTMIVNDEELSGFCDIQAT